MAERRVDRNGALDSTWSRGTSRLAALLLVASLGLGGCVSLPGERTVTDEEWTPATSESLTTWMKTYDKALAKGASTLNSKPLRSITGNARRQSLDGEYRLADQGGAEPTPLSHQKPRFYLPSFDEYPLHGLAVSSDAESGRTVLDLLDRQRAGTDWRSLLTVRLDEGRDLPELRTDGDHPVEPDLNKPGNLRRSPAQMARAFGGLVAATGKDSPFAVFGTHQLVDEHVARNAEFDAAQNSGLLTMEHEPADTTVVRAFETEDGGALVLAGLREQLRLEVGGGEIEVPTDAAAYLGDTVSAGSTVQLTYVWQVAFVLPPASAGAEASPEILGAQRALGDVEASTGG